jgi:recA bacterial DNA recombination protein
MLQATMKSAVAKKEIELALADRFGAIFQQREKQPVEIVPTGVSEIDARLNGFPRGAITEIHGTASSGRTSLLLSALAAATSQEETCALVDTSDSFDLSSAVKARIDCDRLLWVRCSGSVERAFKATDLLLQSGGFGLVTLNLADVAAKYTRRIITSWWFRFRRTIENTPTVLIVVTPVSCIRSSAALVLEVNNEGPVWPNTVSFVLENNGAKLTMKESRSQTAPRLSLVTETALTPGNFSPPLTHSHLLQGIRVRVKQERPVAWTDSLARFRTHMHWQS